MFKFKPKLPKALNQAAMFAVMVRYMDDLVARIKEDFEATVATWEQQPEFKIMKEVGFGKIKVAVETDDQVYLWVSRGVEPHVITPIEPDGLLVYDLGGYDAKTSPDRIESETGGDNGMGEVTASTYVVHPGIEPRNFDQQIRDKWESVLVEYLETMLSEVAQRSGHALEVSLRRR